MPENFTATYNWKISPFNGLIVEKVLNKIFLLTDRLFINVNLLIVLADIDIDGWKVEKKCGTWKFLYFVNLQGKTVWLFTHDCVTPILYLIQYLTDLVCVVVWYLPPLDLSLYIFYKTASTPPTPPPYPPVSNKTECL